MSRREDHLTIGVLAKGAGVKVETIRYYEHVGLMPPPPRSLGGHRHYERAHLRRLGFIRRSRELGFPLDEIRALLGLVDGGDVTCGEVRQLTLHHLGGVRRKIADLKRMERTLADIAEQCEGGAVRHCPIIEALSEGEE